MTPDLTDDDKAILAAWPNQRAMARMTDTIPSTISTDADLFREEAERARRYAAAMTDRKVIDQLKWIATLYDALAVGQDLGRMDRD